MIRNIVALSVLCSLLFSPVSAQAAGILANIVRGTVTDQGDCTNIPGKLMAVYRTETSEGIPFIFETGKTRVMPRWVAPADGQTVLILLGPKVVCTKANGTSREDRRALYYSVSGAQRAVQEARQGGSGGLGSAGIQRLYPANNFPGTISPYTVRTVPFSRPTQGIPGINSPSYGGVGQQIIQDNDTSASDLIRGIAQ